MGFYRHDQLGGCLPCWRDSVTGSSTKGVASNSSCTSIEQTKQSRVNKMQCSSTWLCWWYWCDLASICHILIEVDLKRNSNSNSKWYSNYAKLHLLIFVSFNPCDHTCEMLLKYKWSVVHFNGWSWNSFWIEFEIIPIKSNSKCYWSHFKINSNKVESWKFGKIIFS